MVKGQTVQCYFLAYPSSPYSTVVRKSSESNESIEGMTFVCAAYQHWTSFIHDGTNRALRQQTSHIK